MLLEKIMFSITIHKRKPLINKHFVHTFKKVKQIKDFKVKTSAYDRSVRFC